VTPATIRILSLPSIEFTNRWPHRPRPMIAARTAIDISLIPLMGDYADPARSRQRRRMR
jgi:hypothetical protein